MLEACRMRQTLEANRTRPGTPPNGPSAGESGIHQDTDASLDHLVCGPAAYPVGLPPAGEPETLRRDRPSRLQSSPAPADGWGPARRVRARVVGDHPPPAFMADPRRSPAAAGDPDRLRVRGRRSYRHSPLRRRCHTPTAIHPRRPGARDTHLRAAHRRGGRDACSSYHGRSLAGHPHRDGHRSGTATPTGTLIEVNKPGPAASFPCLLPPLVPDRAPRANRRSLPACWLLGEWLLAPTSPPFTGSPTSSRPPRSPSSSAWPRSACGPGMTT